MASIAPKKIAGHTYYYARECKRVDGKPKIVWQRYLGKAEDIIAKCARDSSTPGAVQPMHAALTDFGAVAALYDLAERLGIREVIDRHVPKRGSGPSVGTYLLVATLNRCVAPCSKASIADWFRGTVLRRLVDVDARQLTSQRYWDNMDRVSKKAIGAIEGDLVQGLVREFDLDLERLLFDATNFFTFIDTFNERCTLAQRGKSKEGRASLRIVGLALLVTSDFHVPLLHQTYPGNQTDAPTFASLIDDLVTRYRQIIQGTEQVTLIFDKGNNSSDNFDALEATPYHFIGSLVPTQHPELLDLSSRSFRSLARDGLPGVRACRLQMEVFGALRTVVVTYNENLFVAQSRTLLREIAKRQEQLHTLQVWLSRWHSGRTTRGKPPTMAGVRKKVAGLLKARHMKDLFRIDLGEQEGIPSLHYRFDQRAWDKLQRTLLGKTILFTDNHSWSNAEIVRGYRSQHHVERAFRDMKDPSLISLRPQFHWTDQKIRVHVFSCVMALTLCSLLQRELQRLGIDLSIQKMIDQLQKIKEVTVVYPPAGRKKKPTIQTTTSELSDLQQSLFDALNLQKHLPS